MEHLTDDQVHRFRESHHTVRVKMMKPVRSLIMQRWQEGNTDLRILISLGNAKIRENLPAVIIGDIIHAKFWT